MILATDKQLDTIASIIIRQKDDYPFFEEIYNGVVNKSDGPSIFINAMDNIKLRLSGKVSLNQASFMIAAFLSTKKCHGNDHRVALNMLYKIWQN